MTEFLLRRGWPLLAGVAVKSLFVLVLAGAVALALRRSSAAARHLVWRLALYGLLLLPLFSWMPAIWQVPLAPRALLVPADAPIVTPGPTMAPTAPAGAAGGVAGRSPLPPSASGRGGQLAGPGGVLTPAGLGAGGRSYPMPVRLCGLWLAGCVLTLLPTLIGLAGVGRLARRSSPLTDGPLPEMTATLARELGVKTPVRLLTGEAGTPMTWGWLRPIILLPPGADGWPPDRLRAVLLHELAHIARADWPAQMAAHLACALYWFNPLAWLAARQARLEGERACDDRVLLAGIPAPDYARHLLDVARSLRDSGILVVVPMARSAGMRCRLAAILGPSRRVDVTRRAVMVGGALLLVFLAGLAVLGVVLRLPATLDASTPVAQGGFTLLAIQRGEGDDSNNHLDTDGSHGTFQHFVDADDVNGVGATALWVRPPRLPGASLGTLGDEYHVSLHTSSGLRSALSYNVADNVFPLDGAQPPVCIDVPPGYPDNYQYMDVTISDRHGHQARWRLTNLPKMQHVLAPTLSLRTRSVCPGFVLEAHVQRYSQNMVARLMTVAVSSPPAHQWEAIIYPLITEWRPESEQGNPAKLTVSETCPLLLKPGNESGYMGTSSPYAEDLHYVGVDAELHQYEVYDESVTFHNVPINYQPHSGYPPYCAVSKPQSVTTASGITVTLPVLTENMRVGMPWINGGIDCEYTTSMPRDRAFLARSPLCRKYHLPVTVQLTPEPPYQTAGTEGQDPAVRLLSFIGPKPYPARVATLTLIVRQRVDLQTLPLHFVVPIEKGTSDAVEKQIP